MLFEKNGLRHSIEQRIWISLEKKFPRDDLVEARNAKFKIFMHFYALFKKILKIWHILKKIIFRKDPVNKKL